MVVVLGLDLQTVIPYRVFPDSFGSHLYWTVMNVQIALPTRNAPRTKRFEAVIDSGATRCVFHANIAAHLGLDLRAGIREMTGGIGGLEETWLHSIALYIPGGPVTITAAFKENLPLAGLLGMNGFFDQFNINFDSAAQQCTLERIYHA